MTEGHPDPELLARYARGELGREESRALERHLASCLVCQGTVDGLPVRPKGVVRWRGHRFTAKKEEAAAPARTPEQLEDLRGVVRALGGILAATSESAASRLLKQPEHRRRALIRQEDRYHTLGLCELLESRCRAAWLVDPEESVEYAKLAALIAQRLDKELYGSKRVEDARAVVWVHLGLSFRLASLPAGEVAEGAGSDDPEAYPTGALGAVVLGQSGAGGAVEAALRETRDAFLERGMGYDAALVTLDLVSAYLQEGRSMEVVALAREAIELLEARNLEPYAVDALRFLLAAAASPEGVTPELVARIARLLQRKRTGAEERFKKDR
jgi:hypothetical protein